MTVVICNQIRKVANGYIVQLRYPFGGDPGGYGEVICPTWADVLRVLSEAHDGLKP